ncbi:MAG: class I SAM-dependent methyltransferase [Spirochaetaceae bacterium]|nr:MAG: class I SAM-dependent methyltransferase [Spirochaetaceae bacterium]
MSGRESARDENAFWVQYIAERNGECQLDDYSADVWRALRGLWNHYRLCRSASILEVGPGWGNYSFRLVEAFDRFAVADLAPVILDYIAEQCSRRGTRRVVTHECTLESLPFENEFDAVLAVNCFYRCESLQEAATQASRAARDLVVFGITSGPIRDDVARVAAVVTHEPKREPYTWRNLLDAAHSAGFRPQVLSVPLVRRYTYATIEEATTAVKNRFRSWEESSTVDVASLIKPAYTHTSDGFSLEHGFEMGLVHWSTTFS